jgi:hypothetical protein
MNQKDKTGKKQEQRRKRAIAAVLVLGAAGLLLRLEGRTWFYIPWIAGIYFLLGILVHPAILSPVDSLVYGIMLGLAWILSHTVLLFLFLFVITPLGLWFRLRGRDRLSLKFPGDKDSFWRRRAPEEQIPKCDKQY